MAKVFAEVFENIRRNKPDFAIESFGNEAVPRGIFNSVRNDSIHVFIYKVLLQGVQQRYQ